MSEQDSPATRYAEPANPACPPTGFKLDKSKAALVVVDPQNDFLSPDGVTWPLVGVSITENKTGVTVTMSLVDGQHSEYIAAAQSVTGAMNAVLTDAVFDNGHFTSNLSELQLNGHLTTRQF